LWGIDLSAAQIAFAEETLRDVAPNVYLLESPMEVDPGLPEVYFDLVFSIYGIGWTTDLAATLTLVRTCLKPGGRLIFSGEHPAYSCLARENDRYVLAEPYTMEGGRLDESWRGVPIVIQHRMLSTSSTRSCEPACVSRRSLKCRWTSRQPGMNTVIPRAGIRFRGRG
jgi:SAM-dependent methyltransferase